MPHFAIISPQFGHVCNALAHFLHAGLWKGLL
jgi:hypothetical protein